MIEMILFASVKQQDSYIVCGNQKCRTDRIEITRRRMQWYKTVPFLARAAAESTLKIDYRVGL